MDITFAELQAAAQPLINLLNSKGDPHTGVLVEQGSVKVLRVTMSLPIEVQD